jgi:hypothetical protein
MGMRHNDSSNNKAQNLHCRRSGLVLALPVVANIPVSMLSHLNISDFAIIPALELDFGDGFTAITGETGAGKSILVDDPGGRARPVAGGSRGQSMGSCRNPEG